MGEILLPWIDGVARHRRRNRYQARNVRETVVAGSEQCELMTANSKRSFSIDLVLLAILRQSEKTVSPGDLQPHPGTGLRVRRTPSGYEVVVVHVSTEFGEWFESRPKTISHRKVHRVISVAHVEGAGVGRDILDFRGNQQVGVGIAVAMSVRRQVVLQQKVADLDVLRNRLPMITRHPGGKVLWRLHASRRGLGRKARHRDRHAGRS